MKLKDLFEKYKYGNTRIKGLHKYIKEYREAIPYLKSQDTEKYYDNIDIFLKELQEQIKEELK